MLTDQQARALVFLACSTRPTGARQWDEHGVMAHVLKLRDKGLSAGEVIDRTLRHAWDVKANTPGVLASPPPTPASNDRSYRPPKGEYACSLHPGEWREGCRLCAADRLVGDETHRPAAEASSDRPSLRELYQQHTQPAPVGLVETAVVAAEEGL